MSAVPDQVIELATRQSGVLSRPQLEDLGVGRGTIDSWLRSRRLLPVHRGVLALGHVPPGDRTRFWAAVLAAGEGAVLSHAAALADAGIRRATGGAVDVTTPGRQVRSRPGIRAHRSDTLAGDEVLVRDGLRVTTVARSLLDSADVLSLDEVERCLAEALALRHATEAEVRAVLVRAPHRPASSAVAALLAPPAGPPFTRSEAERLLLAVLRSVGMGLPLTNRRIIGLEVDAVWLDERLVVEIDGYGPHGTSRARFERDRARSLRLEAAGYRVLRITWRQLLHEQPLVVLTIERALRSSRTPETARAA